MYSNRETLLVLYILLFILIILLIALIVLSIFIRIRFKSGRIYNRIILPGGNTVKIPFHLWQNFSTVQFLEEKRKSDITVISSLLKVYKNLIKRVSANNYPLLYATFYLNMGNVYREWLTGNRTSNLMQAISCYEEVISVASAIPNWSLVALAQVNLSAAYSAIPTGDRTANLEQAITCSQEALRVLTLAPTPFIYSLAQINLGVAYISLPVGNKSTNLQQGISHLKEALRYLTASSYPLEYTKIEINLALAYINLPTGDQTINLQQAISSCHEALRFRSLLLEKDPLNYALVQNNLATAYFLLPTGNRTANLQQTINGCNEAIRYWRSSVDPLHYAQAKCTQGLAYLYLPTGDHLAQLQHAFTCFEEALRFSTVETDPQTYARVQLGLGEAYTDLPTGDRSSNLQHAISCLQKALQFWTTESNPHLYGLTQVDLSVVYLALPTGDRTANLKKSIACSEEALQYLSAKAHPRDYALAQCVLGEAYLYLPTGDRTANLKKSMTCSEEALLYLTAETAPLQYATIQNNLGEAFRNLRVGDRTANFRHAIACYEQSLRFWTAEANPKGYALVQNNLAATYFGMPTRDRAVNLQRAIDCCNEALRFWTAETHPNNYALAQNNLAIAYLDLPAADTSINLQRAIDCCNEALRFWTPETNPNNYALAQNNLGQAYSRILTGDRIDHLKQAITCYQEALRFWTELAHPQYYSMVQNNLGNIYRDFPEGDRQANRRRAIACFQEALRFRTVDTDPLGCFTTNKDLGNMFLLSEEWQASLTAYLAAINAGEQLYQAGLSAESKATETIVTADIYRHASFAAVRCGNPNQALLILEQGKTRQLAESLRLRISRPAYIPDEAWNEYLQACVLVQAVQSESVNTTEFSNEEQNVIKSYRLREREAGNARLALKEAIERVRAYSPSFLRLLDLSALQAQLPNSHTAFITFCITGKGCVGLIVYKDQENVQPVELPHFSRSLLRDLFRRQDEDGAIGGWSGTYRRTNFDRNDETFKAWKETIENTLAVLGQHLLQPICQEMSSQIDHIIFLPSSELFLFPLHAVPISSSERLCDRYQVSYAPSIEILSTTQAKVQSSTRADFYGVINPHDDNELQYILPVGRSIATLFPQYEVTEGLSNTKQRVLTGLQSHNYVHFFCHGSYRWGNPLESGLLLADGRLTLQDLQHAPLAVSMARLVTLSACESGILDVTRGAAEEYVGVPAGFMLIGVPCVVSSLWTVRVLPTTLLMERFYQNHMLHGMSITKALSEAELWLRDIHAEEVSQCIERWYLQSGKSIGKLFQLAQYYSSQAQRNPSYRPFGHPYYWAAFTVNGL